MTLSFVIPVYNEENRLRHCIDELTYAVQSMPDLRPDAWIVDDGSTDKTLEIATAYAAGLDWMHVISRPHLGKGAAVQAGMLAANGDWLMQLDCDCAMPLDQVREFIVTAGYPPLFGFDVVIGSRRMAGSKVQTPPIRRLAGAVFHRLAALLVEDVDTQSGFKLYSGNAAREIFPRVTLTGFGFDVEAIFIARRLGYMITELPIVWYHDADSRISLGRDGLGMLADLATIARNEIAGVYDRIPIEVML